VTKSHKKMGGEICHSFLGAWILREISDGLVAGLSTNLEVILD